MKIEGSIALVTGANRGLGKALVSALVAAGAAKVYAAARDERKVPAASSRVVPLALDTTKPEPRTWENLGSGLPDVWASSLLVDPKDSKSLYVATDEGVFHSANSGATWTKWSEGLYPGVMSVELLLFERDRLLRLVTHGNGVWQRKLP